MRPRPSVKELLDAAIRELAQDGLEAEAEELRQAERSAATGLEALANAGVALRGIQRRARLSRAATSAVNRCLREIARAWRRL